MNEEVTKSENQLIEERRGKLEQLRQKGIAYPNDLKPDSLASVLHEKFDNSDPDQIAEQSDIFCIAGRLIAKRVMGKLAFLRVRDASGEFQFCVQIDIVGEEAFEGIKLIDLGDIIFSQGPLFFTKTKELTLRSEFVKIISKCLRPLPEKFHGIQDQEIKNRQRYLDLITSEDSLNVFNQRFLIIKAIREWFNKQEYIEVETPMMHPIAGGAVARPFKTHHNALDIDLFLRIAPELYLKRLLVGGYRKVFEINRSFRNEGVSTQHNPEFTMLESYEAYADYHDYMILVENLLSFVTHELHGKDELSYQGKTISMKKPFAKKSIEDLLIEEFKELDSKNVRQLDALEKILINLGIKKDESWGIGKVQLELFEQKIESKLLNPTFVIDYPVEVSPLSRRKDSDEFLADRFELFIAGKEIANGFSELNDPIDQSQRFREQVELMNRGDQEAMHYDHDYIRALEFAMPPAAGLGIGIDRLTMLLTDSASIRDVILFPHMRPEVFKK